MINIQCISLLYLFCTIKLPLYLIKACEGIFLHPFGMDEGKVLHSACTTSGTEKILVILELFRKQRLHVLALFILALPKDGVNQKQLFFHTN